MSCSDCDTVSELDDVLGRGTNGAREGVKSVGQQLLLLQDQVSLRVGTHAPTSQLHSDS